MSAIGSLPKERGGSWMHQRGAYVTTPGSSSESKAAAKAAKKKSPVSVWPPREGDTPHEGADTTAAPPPAKAHEGAGAAAAAAPPPPAETAPQGDVSGDASTSSPRKENNAKAATTSENVHGRPVDEEAVAKAEEEAWAKAEAEAWEGKDEVCRASSKESDKSSKGSSKKKSKRSSPSPSRSRSRSRSRERARRKFRKGQVSMSACCGAVRVFCIGCRYAAREPPHSSTRDAIVEIAVRARLNVVLRWRRSIPAVSRRKSTVSMG